MGRKVVGLSSQVLAPHSSRLPGRLRMIGRRAFEKSELQSRRLDLQDYWLVRLPTDLVWGLTSLACYRLHCNFSVSREGDFDFFPQPSPLELKW